MTTVATRKKPVVLIVDDDKNTREGLSRALRDAYEVLLAESGERAMEILRETEVDVLLSDLRMPGMDGTVLLQRALAHHPGLVAIMLTAYGNVETAVDAMKRGAVDFLMKPVDLEELDQRIRKGLRGRDVEAENAALREQIDEKFGLENIIGNAPSMRELFDVIRQVAPTSATVLLQGESGTGKELVARAIHNLSPRAHGPFIAVHCAALSSSLLESEMFGHERGAFTGASERRPGRFELADGGTLFLDEIAEIDPSIQVKLLRVLEERRFERVGGRETLEVDIRLVAATNRDLRMLVDEGKFRQDLFFRLDVVSMVLPPLRDRLDDVPLLCRHMVLELAEKDHKAVEDISPEAVNVLASYSWPGNVRELRNTIEKMVVLARGPKLTIRDVPAHIRHAVHNDGADGNWRGTAGADSTPRSLGESEKMMIYAALKRCDGNRTRAAQELGISRRTLHRKLNEYGQRGEAAVVSGGEGLAPSGEAARTKGKET